MCGIVGSLNWEKKPSSAVFVEACALLKHRGPSSQGFFSWDGQRKLLCEREGRLVSAPFLLGHTRLSILDVSSSGAQPMEHENVVISYNGEVYNYLELRQELISLGVVFTGNSDTEVVLKAYCTWGKSAFKKFVGMFAICIADFRREVLLLVRDRYGIKPLFYSCEDRGLCFASEVGPLNVIQSCRRVVDPEGVYHYLRFGLSDQGIGTLRDSVMQLEPGTVMTVDIRQPGKRSVESFVPPVDRFKTSDLSYDEAVVILREKFLNSVQLHLRSDVPIGVALSGGIDSSAIVGAMRDVSVLGSEIHSFSFVSVGSRVSEHDWARQVVRHCETISHEIDGSGIELREQLPALIRSQGEPFTSASVFAQRLVFKEASTCGIKVVLDGQGADEILAGYYPFIGARMSSLIYDGNYLEALRLLDSASKLPGGSRQIFLSQLLSYFLPGGMQHVLRKNSKYAFMPATFNKNWFAEKGVKVSKPKDLKGEQKLRQALIDNLERTSLPRYLRYADRNSMASSVESRVPFLDQDLVEFCLSLPEAYLLDRDARTKAVFRDAVKGLVPEVVRTRRDKVGFTTPESDYMRNESDFVSELFSSEVTDRIPCLDWQQLRDDWNRFLSGRNGYSPIYWRALTLLEWFRQEESLEF
ncbi:MAG: asparagine synthase (glutamine-hydrolyzing) [Pseudomonadales bacterium]|nr:asparagine synthase (glutamine-hydrolyzing) [Pseudomonadales bacterium]